MWGKERTPANKERGKTRHTQRYKAAKEKKNPSAPQNSSQKCPSSTAVHAAACSSLLGYLPMECGGERPMILSLINVNLGRMQLAFSFIEA